MGDGPKRMTKKKKSAKETNEACLCMCNRVLLSFLLSFVYYIASPPPLMYFCIRFDSISHAAGHLSFYSFSIVLNTAVCYTRCSFYTFTSIVSVLSDFSANQRKERKHFCIKKKRLLWMSDFVRFYSFSIVYTCACAKCISKMVVIADSLVWVKRQCITLSTHQFHRNPNLLK